MVDNGRRTQRVVFQSFMRFLSLKFEKYNFRTRFRAVDLGDVTLPCLNYSVPLRVLQQNMLCSALLNPPHRYNLYQREIIENNEW